jgi:hypothetical protein
VSICSTALLALSYAGVAAADPLPAGATSALQSVFAADANAQLNGGSPQAAGAADRSRLVSAQGAQQLSSIYTRDADAAAYTESQGGPVWDSDTVTLSNATITGSSGSQVNATVDVTEIFHIAGTPHNGTPPTISGEVLPYSVVLNNTGGSWQLQSVAQTSNAGEPAPTGPVPAFAARAMRLQAHHRLHPRKYTPRASAAGYIGNYAVAYAGAWWNGRNPAYQSFSNDCMNFASQIIHAGGENTGPVWHPYTSPWINVESFDGEYGRDWIYAPDGGVVHFRGSDNSQVQPGWLIALNWSGLIENGIAFTHEMFIDGKSGNTLLLAGHTNDRWNWPSTTLFSENPNAFYVVQRPNA